MNDQIIWLIYLWYFLIGFIFDIEEKKEIRKIIYVGFIYAT